MTLQEALSKSEIILIEGEKKVGKLTFCLHECAYENKEKILIFSAYNKPIIYKRLEAIKNQKIKSINAILPKIEVLALKEEWASLKSKHGIDFLIKDVQRAVEKHKPDAIIFHKFDNFFEPHEINTLKIFMEEIVNMKESYNYFKLFFTVSVSETNRPLTETMEDFSDINLEIKKHGHRRVIYVKNSIFPVKTYKCEMINENGKLNFVPYKDAKTPSFKEIDEERKIHILLISNKEDLIKLFSYLFNRKNFFFDVASKTSEIINKILSEPDIIIYNPLEKELDFSVCHTIKEQKLKSKLIYITNENYIRSDDKITAVNEGCYDVFPYNFNIVDFLSEIEKILNINFYTINVEKIIPKTNIKNKKHFCEIADSLYEEKIFFIILKLSSKKEIKKELLRKKDFIYKNKENYLILLLNTKKENAPAVLNKLFDSNDDYDLKSIYDATEWQEKKEEICK
jgi:hypothetical protein